MVSCKIQPARHNHQLTNQQGHQTNQQGLYVPEKAYFWGKNGHFWAKHPHYFGREQKFWYLYIRKPPRHLIRIVFFGRT